MKRKLTSKQRLKLEMIKSLNGFLQTCVLACVIGIVALLGFAAGGALFQNASAGMQTLWVAIAGVLAYILIMLVLPLYRSGRRFQEEIEFGVFTGDQNTSLSAFLHKLETTGLAAIETEYVTIATNVKNGLKVRNDITMILLVCFYRNGWTKKVSMNYGDLRDALTKKTPWAKATRGSDREAWRKIHNVIRSISREEKLTT